jgi:hypothetical protein
MYGRPGADVVGIVLPWRRCCKPHGYEDLRHLLHLQPGRGISKTPLTHAEVQEAANNAAPSLKTNYRIYPADRKRL